jgi:hypothetical protein
MEKIVFGASAHALCGGKVSNFLEHGLQELAVAYPQG